MNATSVDEEFNPSVHVYEPHKVGLPALRPYFKALWQRREFAAEMSRTNIRAANTNTFFGQVWLVLNPLLLAAVYYLLVDIIAGGSAKVDAAERFARVAERFLGSQPSRLEAVEVFGSDELETEAISRM